NRCVFVDTGEGEWGAVLVPLGIVRPQRDLEARRRLEPQRTVQGDDVLVAQIEAIELADHVTVTFAEAARNAGSHCIAQRYVQGGEPFDQVVTTRAQPSAPRNRIELRLLRSHKDRTADGITAEQ